MIHRCICSQYSLKVPRPQKETKIGLRGHSQPSCSPQEAEAPLGEGALPAGRGSEWSGTSCGARAGLAISYQVSVNKVLKTSVPLPREGRGEDT